MKRLLLLSAALLCSLLIQAQITDNKTLEPKMVTKASVMGATLIEANWYEGYTSFNYEDTKYQQLKVRVFFSMTTEELDSFYNEVKNRFMKNDYAENEGFVFETKEGTTVHTNFVKSMGVKSMRFSTSKNGVISTGMYLTQKQIKKLFNDQTKS